MSSSTETAALVALLRIGARESHIYAQLVEERGSAMEVLSEERGANTSAPSLFVDNGPDGLELMLARAVADVDRWRAQGRRLVSVLDPQYPENLRSVHDHPPLLFVGGRLQAADARAVAVVGSRRGSERGLATARMLAACLVEHGYTVVSGLAAGIDAAAHTAALQCGRTIAVLGTGLSHCYPPQNADLQRRIAGRCAVVSQFWPQTPPGRHTFPIRNAVISGLALATVIVEASYKSGARSLARRALAHGRPVLLWDALLEQEWACDLSARSGVHVVASPEEVIGLVARLTSAGSLVA